MPSPSSTGRLVLLPAFLGVAVLGGTLASRLGTPADVPTQGERTDVVVAAGGVPSGMDVPEPPAAVPDATPVRAAVRVEPYRVTGHSVESLLASLRDGGPRVDGDIFFGLTSTTLAYRFAYRERAGLCETTDARVDLDVTITIPEWQSTPSAPYELRRDWQRFAQALRRHEERHRDLAVEHAHAVRRAVDGLRAPTCDAVAGLAARRAEQAQAVAEAAHRAYDASTGHGESEGAVWPPR